MDSGPLLSLAAATIVCEDLYVGGVTSIWYSRSVRLDPA